MTTIDSAEHASVEDEVRTSLRRQLGDLCSSSGEHTPAQVWAQLSESGWLEAAVPETPLDPASSVSILMALMEEFGRALVPAPVEAAVGYLPALLARTTCREAAASWLTGIIEGRVRPACAPRTLADLALHDLPAIEGIEGAWKLTGSVPRLQVTPDVTHAILQARSPEGEAMLLIVPLEREGLDLVIEETVDLTLASGHLTAAGVDVQDAEIIGDECETCQDAHRVASLLYGLALDMTAVGGASAAIEATIAYVSQRTQFGAVIGSFQAIQHQIANAYIEVELARSLVIDACRMLEDGLGTDVESAASYSRLFASQMYVKTSQVAIQCHGGYGFTWEQGIHGFYKRAIYGRQFASSTSRHRAVVANALRATAQQDGERHR